MNTPKPKLEMRDQLLAYLAWSRCAFPQLHIASTLFKIPVTTANRYLITSENYLYFSLESPPIWPTQDVVQASILKCFKETYPNTRCIIECTELFVQMPSPLNTQSAMYSTYKHHCSYKGLVSISLSGAVTFISGLYPGSLSDKEITERSGFLNPAFWTPGDSVMADRDFTIEDQLRLSGVSLKGELQRENKLISYERAFKMLENDMYIAGIGQAVLELLSFKVESGNHQRGIFLLQKFSDIFGNMRLVPLKMTSHLTSHNFQILKIEIFSKLCKI